MLNNLTIRKKIFAVLILPLLGFILASIKLSMDNYSEKNNLEELQIAVILSTKLSKLVHETQKERGATAGFVGSGGKKFVVKLPEQRKLTNKRLKELKTFIKGKDFSKINQDLANALNTTMGSLSKLNDIRAKVNNLSISLGDVLKYYTTNNAKILDTVSNIIKSSNNKDITKQLSGYSNFLLSKERAGIERAVGAGTLAKNKFSPKLKIKFIKLLAAQDSFMSNFLVFASQKDKDFYHSTMMGNDIDEVNRIRKILLSKNENFGVDSSFGLNK